MFGCCLDSLLTEAFVLRTYGQLAYTKFAHRRRGQLSLPSFANLEHVAHACTPFDHACSPSARVLATELGDLPQHVIHKHVHALENMLKAADLPRIRTSSVGQRALCEMQEKTTYAAASRLARQG